MSRITDYILEPKVVYTEGGFLVRVKVIDDYKYKKYIVSENLHYKTVQGTSFTLTDASSTKQASITELKGNTTQEGTPTPSNPIEVETVSGDNEVVVCGKNIADTEHATILNAYFDGSHTSVTSASTNRTTYFRVNPNTTYTVSKLKSIRSFIGTTETTPVMTTAISNIQNVSSGTYDGTTRVSGTITTGANDKYIVVNYANINTDTGDRPTTILNSIQIEKGSTATTYSSYTGNSYRVDLGGKNLLNNTLSSGTNNGITYTVNEDKSVTMNGTATATTWLILNSSISLEAGTYTMSQGNTTNAVRVYCSALSGYCSNGVRTQTITETKTSDIAINIPNGTTISNLTLYPMVEKGSTATPYSPHVSNPIELCKIGNYRDRLKISEGNNLYQGFSFSKTTSGITFTYNTDGSIKVNGTATANATSMYSSEATSYLFNLSSGTYTLSGAGLTANVRVEIVKSNGTLLAQTDNNLYKSFTINEDTNVFLRVYIASGTTVKNLFIYPMLNKGTTALPYEPYGIDKWYIEKNIAKVTYEGTNMTNVTSGSTVYKGLYSNSATPNKIASNNVGLFFERAKFSTVARRTENTIYENQGNVVCVGSTTDTLDSLKEKYNGSLLYYVLNSPTYTEITDTYLLEQLNGLLDIELYENLCYVDWIGSIEPTMTLQYAGTEDLGIKYIITEDGKKIRTDWRKLGRRKKWKMK